MSQLTLTEIWIYPIKSLPGVRMPSGVIREKGIVGDRRMMLIDESNQFITQREAPKMSQFKVGYDGQSVFVGLKGNIGLGEIVISTAVDSNKKLTAAIWDDTVEVVEVDLKYSEWFSKALEMNCRLVFFPESNERRIDPEYVKEEKHVSLSDGYPYLIIGTNSLRDLNERIGRELPMKRFRPNFVFEGGTPYEEDGWKDFNIGSVRFSGVKPCGRCAITTIDPETGIKGDEPLRTLATYRRVNGKVIFGENVIAHNQGEVKEGDEIKLL